MEDSRKCHKKTEFRFDAHLLPCSDTDRCQTRGGERCEYVDGYTYRPSNGSDFIDGLVCTSSSCESRRKGEVCFERQLGEIGHDTL